MKRVAVITSGGDAPGMNAAVRAIVRKAVSERLEVVGYESGFQGIIEGKGKKLDITSVGGIIDRGGTFLGTARSDEFMTKEGQEKALNTFKRDKIEGFIVIGGEGSYRGAQVFHDAGIMTIGLPGSIDNDIAGTDNTIGFDTCINTVSEAISKIRDTASAHERIFVIEVMGRTCGMIALHAGLASGADYILVPEYPYEVDTVCAYISRGFDRGKLHSIIVVAEGVGTADQIANEIGECVGHEVKKSVLGYIQRGGSPTAWDRVLASRMGAKAVDLIVDGKSGLAVGISGADIASTTLEYAYSNKRQINKKLLDLAGILAR